MVSCRQRSLLMVTSLAVLGVIYLQGRTNLRLRFLTPGNITQRNTSVRQRQGDPSPSPVTRYTVLNPDQIARMTEPIAHFTDIADRVDDDNHAETEDGAQFLIADVKNLSKQTDRLFNGSYKEALEKMQRAEKEHRARLDNLQSTCHKLVTDRRPIRQGNISTFYYSKDYNFAYCKVPKSGSTFWTKLFMALLKGDSFAKQMSKWPRAEIHSRSNVLRTSPIRLLHDKVPTVVISRNPYTRLYSAFVDKVYLPLYWEQLRMLKGVVAKPSYFVNYTQEVLKGPKSPLNGRLARYRNHLSKKGLLIRQNVSVKVTPICANNVSFEQFLSFIISDSKTRQILEPHWAPISHLCHPCKFNTFRIVKQETFSEDLEFTLRSVKVDLDRFPSIHNTLHERRAENSIPSIVAVVQNKAFSRNVNACTSQGEIVRRVWKSLQIQGFIKDNVAFPNSIVGIERFDKVPVTDAILDTIKRNPMTSLEREQQRHSHLVDAYKSVDKGILEEIKNIYRMDFLLFNYSTTPPS